MQEPEKRQIKKRYVSFGKIRSLTVSRTRLFQLIFKTIFQILRDLSTLENSTQHKILVLFSHWLKCCDKRSNLIILFGPLTGLLLFSLQLITNAQPIYPLLFRHPSNHISFATTHKKEVGQVVDLEDNRSQRLWEEHCIENTWGSKIPNDHIAPGDLFWKKGTDRDIDSYSAFRNDAYQSTKFDLFLKERDVDTIFVCGLAYDVCVGLTGINLYSNTLQMSNTSQFLFLYLSFF